MEIASLRVRPHRLLLVMLVLVLPALMVGCGKDVPKHAVSGKVVHDGQPVTGGGFTFTPVAEGESTTTKATPVIAVIQSDGTFQMNAAEGKYQVLYSAPTESAPEPAEGEHSDPSKAPVSPFAGLVPKDPEIEVTSGTNEITIELVSAE
jgi:hypothetical protein